jgi:hypothetical protein
MVSTLSLYLEHPILNPWNIGTPVAQSSRASHLADVSADTSSSASATALAISRLSRSLCSRLMGRSRARLLLRRTGGIRIGFVQRIWSRGLRSVVFGMGR